MLSLIIAYILSDTLFLPTVFAVTCRKLIKRVWMHIVDFLMICWHAFISVLYLCVASFIVMSLAAGSTGGYFLSEYLTEHVTPFVCIAIFAFADLFLQVNNLFAKEGVSLSRAERIHASDVVVNSRSFFSAFSHPTPVLLQ